MAIVTSDVEKMKGVLEGTRQDSFVLSPNEVKSLTSINGEEDEREEMK